MLPLGAHSVSGVGSTWPPARPASPTVFNANDPPLTLAVIAATQNHQGQFSPVEKEVLGNPHRSLNGSTTAKESFEVFDDGE